MDTAGLKRKLVLLMKVTPCCGPESENEPGIPETVSNVGVNVCPSVVLYKRKLVVLLVLWSPVFQGTLQGIKLPLTILQSKFSPFVGRAFRG